MHGALDAGEDRKTEGVACTRRLLRQSGDNVSLKAQRLKTAFWVNPVNPVNPVKKSFSLLEREYGAWEK